MNVGEMQLVLPDIPRIYTALAEWLACLLCVFEMKRRFSGWKLAGISAAALTIQASFLELTGGIKNLWWMVCMAVAIGLMYLFIWLCTEADAKDVGYYCVRAFVVAEFAASLEWQMECFFYYALDFTTIWMRIVCLVGIYTFVFAITRLIYRRYAVTDSQLLITNKELISYVIIGLAVFLVSNMGFVASNTPFGGRYMTEVFNVRTLIDLGGVAILYAYHVQRMELRLQHELESVQTILHNQYMQYEQSQEAVEIINYKYHDLKHHIIALRAEASTEKQKEYLDRMETEIQNYEAQNKTGNKVLDTLLTSKNLYCMKNHISMTSVVDGTLFDFMDAMDICSIFGNALDNAIEYERNIPEREKRMIHVTACSRKSFLIIGFENYCEDSLEYASDLPVTTKGNTQFHGYGLKSLRYTVRKYGGEVDVNTQDNWFKLKILIPMKI